MEKLILKCGRYVPQAAGDTETRVRAVEAYLAVLTEELELLVGEMDKALETLMTLLAERDGLAAAAMATDEEGGV